MIKFKREQWSYLADALREIANIAAAAMIFGHLLAARPFEWPIAVAGASLWLGLIGVGLVLKGGWTQ